MAIVGPALKDVPLKLHLPSVSNQIGLVHEDIDDLAHAISTKVEWAEGKPIPTSTIELWGTELYWLNKKLRGLYELQKFNHEIEAVGKRYEKERE